MPAHIQEPETLQRAGVIPPADQLPGNKWINRVVSMMVAVLGFVNALFMGLSGKKGARHG